MLIVNSNEMKNIDRISIDEYHLSDEVLMENAGFEFVNLFLEDYDLSNNDRLAIFCGGGNNGGDGFVIARHLKRRGFNIAVYTFVNSEKLKGIALLNYKRLFNYKIPVIDVSTIERFEKNKDSLLGFDIYIDALLGIGFHGKPRGIIEQAIIFINNSKKKVFSVDMPSGIDANLGQVNPLAVRAEKTYTMGFLKYGLLDFPGKGFSKRINVLDIGFPKEAVEKINISSHFIEKSLASKLLPERKADSHKGSFGHLAIISGKIGFEGASIMASKSAIRSGCGLVTILFPSGKVINKPDEIISAQLPFDEEYRLKEDADIKYLLSKYNAIVIGPGMGVFNSAIGTIEKLLKLNKKIIIDADGLNNISQNIGILNNKSADIVLTPHIGEMSRLCGLGNKTIKMNKIEVAKDFSKKYKLTVVLKDSVTVVATKEGEIFINDGGVSSLAKGGSGDVLSGIIGSLMARGLSGRDAAIVGVFLHTECGRIAQNRLYEDCVKANDLIELLPEAFKNLRS